MKVLVLGSDGQIGRPLVKHLRGCGHIVAEFDNYSNPKKDLRIPGILNNILADIDFVFFLAFDVGGAVYLNQYQNTHEFISNNVKIMSNTFDSLKKYHTPFLFASSQMSEMSHSTYGILKLIGERYSYNIGKVVKFWNVYGPEESTEKAHVITHFISMAQVGKIQMRTTGDEMRQMLYVGDCCECLTILMDKYWDLDNKTFDVSSFEWIKIKHIARIIADIYKCDVVPGEANDDVQRSELKDPDKNILNYWQPKTNIITGIKYCINERNNCNNSSL